MCLFGPSGQLHTSCLRLNSVCPFTVGVQTLSADTRDRVVCVLLAIQLNRPSAAFHINSESRRLASSRLCAVFTAWLHAAGDIVSGHSSRRLGKLRPDSDFDVIGVRFPMFLIDTLSDSSAALRKRA